VKGNKSKRTAKGFASSRLSRQRVSRSLVSENGSLDISYRVIPETWFYYSVFAF